ncbi:MAG: hypothetical protein HC800_15535 [Phormidesmis sp. RL_2_1]|nr:hypothetical protein [Phormidesmis sp. RL_2_1]
MAIAIDSTNLSLSNTNPNTSLPLAFSASSILRGVDAVALNDLPLVWQQIAGGGVNIGHSDPDFLVALARLFLPKEPTVVQKSSNKTLSRHLAFNHSMPKVYTRLWHSSAMTF